MPCRERLRQFPSLVNCCTIDWYTAWPADALSAVATKFLTPVAQAVVGGGGGEGAAPDAAAVGDMAQGLAGCCRLIHRDSAELSARFRREAGRVNYVTPTSYLELLTMFATLLDRRRGAVAKQQKRYSVRAVASAPDCGHVDTSPLLIQWGTRICSRQ